MQKLFFFIGLILMMGCESTPTKTFTEADINLIPKPKNLQLNEGSFSFNKSTVFVVENDEQLQASQLLIDKFKTVSGWDLQVVKTKPTSNYVVFSINDALDDEAYHLTSNSDGVTVESNSFSGFLYGVETIRQLLPPSIDSPKKVEGNWVIPSVAIKDAPRFKWRGLMLDVSRHFFQKDYIKKTIDRLAMLKMNTLHWHLVDDQGWRIEIKKYPKLTEVGAWRVDQEDKPWDGRYTPKMGEKATYGGFYTQEDIKEVVAYAQTRGVTVVPEIEMPVHVTSAIASYPELSCHEQPVMVPSGGVWPITDIYCAGKESTFEFLENVLVEVMDLFPSKYIHVGGDEATKTNWKTCKHCQKRIKDEGLQNVEELQSYFIKRMERFISSKGRVLIGWDEILEGGLAPGATVMSWRGVKGGLEASAEGHDVVMTPGTHCYFDHYQGSIDLEPKAWGGYSPVSKVYQFDPVVDGMSKEQANHVLGGQANLWSEFIPNEAQSEYMIYPRIAALSEALWSPKENRSWDEFAPKMEQLFKRFDQLEINYAKSAYNVSMRAEIDSTDTSAIHVIIENEIPNPDIRYVLNDADINTEAIPYKSPVKITKTSTISAVLFKDGKPVGKVFTKTFNFHKAVGKKVIYNKKYHDNYKGQEAVNMVNVIRGTKNFHDGQWQAWLSEDMDLTIDLGEAMQVSKVTVGAMENQNPDIYFPTQIEVLLSSDNKTFTRVSNIEREFKANAVITLKDFVANFKATEARYVKVKARNLGKSPKGTDCWTFIDEIIVE